MKLKTGNDSSGFDVSFPPDFSKVRVIFNIWQSPTSTLNNNWIIINSSTDNSVLGTITASRGTKSDDVVSSKHLEDVRFNNF